ncbi:RAMP superfamily protein [Iningainema tapete]|uniref:RAMP superfamily protein n=1 Tax=Iningainema tapete BLCC-T55 TaxID=2748662 RepID=A0A8J7CAN5_9CYAN|nr:RAMP superfamily protein [Iningainema tapete]MBD2777331.1 RAMP superfamily protein [Iningainema tapete BLCC-T55]
MPKIPDAAKKVPLMFQAQTAGRCQLQYLKKNVPQQDAERWASEWIEKAYPDAPDFGTQVQTRDYTISWRFVTNGGQDEGVTRPVIGARGWPYYPGSSMKGIFGSACSQEQRDRYCGNAEQPGILRFHGGYPTSDNWEQNLVDIVHPQQDWQVKEDEKSAGAFVQISLYKPQLKFGISSTIPLKATEWETIWNIWEKALSTGIGCRVCAGYGQPEKHTGAIIYQTQLQGQGQASKLLDGTGEFRPNMLRAALRGHALRIFGGLTNANTADGLVETLFGGVQGEGTVGLLSMSFRETNLELEEFGKRAYAMPTYKVAGYLTWLLTQNLPDPEREALQTLVKALTRFAMLLGGFGKSWRRADHRLFFPEYYEQEDPKPLIGCHWQWLGKKSLLQDVRVRKLEQVSQFINEVRQAASNWMQLQGITPNPHNYAPWREAWHPEVVKVWGRLANEPEDCEAIRWLHSPYREAIPKAKISEGSIYRSSVTGQVGQIGRIWHRMYPIVRLVKDPQNPSAPIPKTTNQYLEFLTFFPDDSLESEELLDFLESHPKKIFQKLWGN